MARPDSWNEEQIATLVEFYPSANMRELVNLLPFTKSQIYQKAAHLGLKREDYSWTKEEVRILRDNYSVIPMKKLVEVLPNRTLSSIRTKAGKLGLNTYKQMWSEEEIEILKEYYPIKTKKEMEEMLPLRHSNTIIDMAGKLGIKKKKGFRKNYVYSTEELLDKLKAFALKLGRTPLQEDLSANPDVPGVLTYYRHFGSYSNACIEAGLEVNNQMYGKSYTSVSENNDLCLSSKELLITNLLISNDIPYEKEKLYRDILNNQELKYIRSDWYINDSIVVEYFGMPEKKYYAKRMEEKIELCKENHVPLISLLPEDLNLGMIGLINKFAYHGIKIVV
ncbi:hypothetical protein EVU96_09385 [Bacillus infantis]|nr:hypothetical protein EVU96_09385 [Bacillus infantis]